MSENLHYKAIQSLITELVAAIQEFPDLQSLLQKAWNKEIIEKSSVNDLAIHSDSDPEEIAQALVSAVASSVSKKPEIFYRFINLLRDSKHKSLSEIASRLEQKLESIVDMSGPSEASKSSSLSDQQPKPKHASPSSARKSSDPKQPFTSMRKDKAFELPTLESGFQEASGSMGPIAGEPVVSTFGGSDAVFQTPYVAPFTSVSGGNKTTLVRKPGASNTCSTEVQDAIVSDPSSSPGQVSVPEMGHQPDELLVLGSKNTEGKKLQQQEAREVMGPEFARKDEKIQEQKVKIDRQNTEISDLKAKLVTSQDCQQKLQEKVDSLTKEKRELEKKLSDKEEESQKQKSKQSSIISNLESQLKDKDTELEALQNKLAEVEQQSEDEKKNLWEKINSLEEEKKELQSTVKDMKNDQEKQAMITDKQLFELEKKIHEKDREKLEFEQQIGQLEIKVAKQKQELAEKDKEISDGRNEYLEMENKSLKEQLEREKAAKSPQPPPNRQLSSTESTGSGAGLPPQPAASQISTSSETESTGQMASRSNSNDTTQQSTDNHQPISPSTNNQSNQDLSNTEKPLAKFQVGSTPNFAQSNDNGSSK